MRARRAVLAAVAALMVSPPAGLAGPLDPPPDRIEAWLVEFAGGEAMPQLSDVHLGRMGPGPVMIEFIGFEVRGGRRELFGGMETTFLGPMEGNYNYPVVYSDDRTVTPPCRLSVVCYQPEVLPGQVFPLAWGRETMRQSFYVVALNAEIERITASPGWRTPRRISSRDFAVRMVGYTGTGIYTHGVSVQRFRHAETSGGRYGSVAFGMVPCNFPLAPPLWRCDVRLTGADPSTAWWAGSNDRINSYGDVVRGAASRPTRWVLDGESFGWGPTPYNLVVVDLPRFR